MRQRVSQGLVAALGLAIVGPALAQEAKTPPKPAEVAKGGQGDGGRVAGVIYKIEAAESSDAKGAKRLRVNTSIPWEDFVRDQARSVAATKDDGKAEGKDSVAVLGHPRENDVVVVVEAAADVAVERRFRTAADDATRGAATPEGALKAEEKAVDPTKEAGKTEGEGQAKIKVDALKEGQFVEVTFPPQDGPKRASRVFVFVPVDRTATPAKDGNARAPGKAADKP